MFLGRECTVWDGPYFIAGHEGYPKWSLSVPGEKWRPFVAAASLEVVKPPKPRYYVGTLEPGDVYEREISDNVMRVVATHPVFSDNDYRVIRVWRHPLRDDELIFGEPRG